jgi:hypothetical protein
MDSQVGDQHKENSGLTSPAVDVAAPHSEVPLSLDCVAGEDCFDFPNPDGL